MRLGCDHLIYTEVFDAEAYGALQGLAAAKHIGSGKHIYICLDNTSVIDGLNGDSPESSQSTFLRFQHIASTHQPGVTIKWVPGHQDIEGNEAADKLAKEGAVQEYAPMTTPTISWTRRHLRDETKQDFAKWWKAQREHRYDQVSSFAVTKQPLVSYRRSTIHRLLAARSAHGDFAAYHERFRHEDSNNHCSCGERKTPTHIFFCRKLRGNRLLPRHAPRAATLHFLGEGSQKLAKLLERSDFFTRICPR